MKTPPPHDEIFSSPTSFLYKRDNITDPPSKKLWGTFVRKERWGLSWRGRLLVIAIVLSGLITTLLWVHPFLTVTERVDSKILVVEGWIHQFAAVAAVEEFKAHSYQQVYTTGGPVNGLGHYVNDYQTSASVGAGLLRVAGIPAELVQIVPSHEMSRDRTYSSALALQDWFREHNITAQSINVLTEDCHARRTRLLFQEALGKGVKMGIVSVPNPDYDAKRWWRYSEGVREVIGESLAHVYAKFLFWPSKTEKEH